MRYRIVRFRQVDVDRECGVVVTLVSGNIINNGLQCKSAVRVWAEGVLGGGDEVVLSEVEHELIIDDCVQELGDDGKQGDRSVVLGQRLVLGFVELDGLGEF